MKLLQYYNAIVWATNDSLKNNFSLLGRFHISKVGIILSLLCWNNMGGGDVEEEEGLAKLEIKEANNFH